MPGQDYEVTAHITLDDAVRGTTVDLNLTVPEYDEHGRLHRVERAFKARIPKGATDGQRLRLRGKGGKGFGGGPDGDLYLNIALHPHALFRVSGHDLYLDLPLAPWEAALGAVVEVPTLGGSVHLKVPPGTHRRAEIAAREARIAKTGAGEGDLFAIVQIVVPTVLSERERALFKELAEGSTFNPRGHFEPEMQAMKLEQADAVWLEKQHEFSLAELAHCPACRRRNCANSSTTARWCRTIRDEPHGPSADIVVTVQAAGRLRADLELDPQALALALTLIDRIHTWKPSCGNCGC